MEGLDPELKAMSDIAQVLAKLDNEDSRARVLRWVAEKYTPSAPFVKNQTPTPRSTSTDDVSQDTEEAAFDSFVDLYDAVNPTTDVDRLLTGAYWLQVVQNRPSWKAFEVNKLLKDTGYGVNSISNKLGGAQERKPALVRQMSKSGKARQATKVYKLTTAGVDYIAARLPK